MNVHYLKTVQPYFGAVKQRLKKFEIRKNDRNFQVGEFIMLQEYVDGKFTGRNLLVLIEYKLENAQKFGLKKDYVILGLKFKEEWNEDQEECARKIIEEVF